MKSNTSPPRFHCLNANTKPRKQPKSPISNHQNGLVFLEGKAYIRGL